MPLSHSASAQDSRESKAPAKTVVSLDDMLDRIDAFASRIERNDRKEKNAEAAEMVSAGNAKAAAASPSGYVGTIPMNAGVSASGARTYSIPIMTTDAPGGAPAVSLEYNSQGSFGAAGYGWEIGGLSTITARNKNQYYDGTVVPASPYLNPV